MCIADSTGEIAEATPWQKFECFFGIGDGREKASSTGRRLFPLRMPPGRRLSIRHHAPPAHRSRHFSLTLHDSRIRPTSRFFFCRRSARERNLLYYRTSPVEWHKITDKEYT